MTRSGHVYSGQRKGCHWVTSSMTIEMVKYLLVGLRSGLNVSLLHRTGPKSAALSLTFRNDPERRGVPTVA